MIPTTVLHDVYRVALHALSRPGIARMVPNAATPDEAAKLLIASAWEVDQPPLIFDGEPRPEVLANLDRGTDEFPESADLALIIIECAVTTRTRLTGPGVKDTLQADLPLSAPLLMSRNEVCAAWPRGIDLILIGAGPTFIGLPRTTRVELVS